MAKCKIERLEAFLDGEVAPSAAFEIESHIMECSQCRQALEAMRRLRGCIGNLPAAAPPAEIRARAMQAAYRACEQVRPLLDAYLDGEVEPATRGALGLHFGVCAECRQELLARRQVAGAINSLPEVTAPAAIRERARAALAGQQAQARTGLLGRLFAPVLSGGWAPRAGLAAAAATVVLALVWVLPAPRERNATTAPGPRDAAPGIAAQPHDTAPETAEAPAAEERALAEADTTVGEEGTEIAAEPSNPSEGRPRIVVRNEPPRRAIARADNTGNAIRASYETERTATAAVAVEEEEIAALLEEEREEFAAREEEAGEDARHEVASIPHDLPKEVAETRINLLRAAEEYHALRTESFLSRLPEKVEKKDIDTKPEPTVPPESDVSRTTGGLLV